MLTRVFQCLVLVVVSDKKYFQKIQRIFQTVYGAEFLQCGDAPGDKDAYEGMDVPVGGELETDPALPDTKSLTRAKKPSDAARNSLNKRSSAPGSSN